MILEVGPRLYNFLVLCVASFTFYIMFDIVKIMIVGDHLLPSQEDKTENELAE